MNVGGVLAVSMTSDEPLKPVLELIGDATWNSISPPSVEMPPSEGRLSGATTYLDVTV